MLLWCASATPEILLLPVWPLPRSLATTCGISVDFSSSPYLDVSVQAVPRICLFDSAYADEVLLRRVSPFGHLRIKAYLQLPEAFRSLSRPSSAPDAKAFPLRPFSLDLFPRGVIRKVDQNYAGFLKKFFLAKLYISYPKYSTISHSRSLDRFAFSVALLVFHSHCSVFKVRSLVLRTRWKHLNFFKRFNPSLS